jgi:excisionase family DNA binding protein
MTRSNPPRSPMVTRLRTINETAQILNVSARTVRRLIQSGELPAHRIRGLLRISDADIAAFLAEH